MITSLIILLPVLVGLLLWHQLPEQIPVHFNSEGVADSYQSKLWGVTFIYLVIFACHWFAAIITSVDPRRRNISSKIYRLVLWICPVISVFVGVTIYGTAWMLCGVLEIIVGFLPIAQFEIVMIALILLATIPVAVYSYLLYRKKMG